MFRILSTNIIYQEQKHICFDPFQYWISKLEVQYQFLTLVHEISPQMLGSKKLQILVPK